MYSVISSNLPRARRSLARATSSLTPGHVLQGACWNYSILEHVEGDHTHNSDVFKAKVGPRENARVLHEAPEWFVLLHHFHTPKLTLLLRALIKKASKFEYATENLQREVKSYDIPGVASAGCFREMYEQIDDSTITLEWLDTTLAEVKYLPDMRTYSIIKSVLRTAFTSCVVLEDHKQVNTDYKPANILLSNINTDHIIAKVEDLGLVVPVGELFHAQPYDMRDLEVFLKS
ncbi:unnamed protein product [Penicillium salamii]|uniref:Protein kinase domain-containing protein n=1 Tax=Penicillium salamii TaxID=1612424 RepID=A0A9W4J077_9EURO|nr:unnamed protein product [Penicillium salamii]